MSRALVHEIEVLLAEAGFGAGSGLSTHSQGEAVAVSWQADTLIRPTITAHASDPDLHATAEITGIRSALSMALTSVFRAAGLTAVDHPDGYILVTRPVPPTVARAAPAVHG